MDFDEKPPRNGQVRRFIILIFPSRFIQRGSPYSASPCRSQAAAGFDIFLSVFMLSTTLLPLKFAPCHWHTTRYKPACPDHPCTNLATFGKNAEVGGRISAERCSEQAQFVDCSNLSHTMYELNGFGKSTPHQNRSCLLSLVANNQLPIFGGVLIINDQLTIMWGS